MMSPAHVLKQDRAEAEERAYKRLVEGGMTCMPVTHEMGFAREVADHIYFTDHGVIVEHGPPGELFGRPRAPRTREFLSRILRSG